MFLAEPTNISGFPWQNEGAPAQGSAEKLYLAVNRVMVNEF